MAQIEHNLRLDSIAIGDWSDGWCRVWCTVTVIHFSQTHLHHLTVRQIEFQTLLKR